MTATRRALLAAAPALLMPGLVLAQGAATPGLSPEDRALVAKASAYLEGVGEAQGRFTQTNARGAVTTGAVYIKRPGKARFAYDPPSALLVVSDGYNVSVWDGRLKTFERYPLGQTPLSLFLSRHIRLDQGVVVSRVARTPDGFAITVRDGRKQAEGQATLVFADTPVGLKEWVLTDPQGQTTRVVLSDLHATTGLAGSLFGLRDPRPVSGRPR